MLYRNSYKFCQSSKSFKIHINDEILNIFLDIADKKRAGDIC